MLFNMSSVCIDSIAYVYVKRFFTRVQELLLVLDVSAPWQNVIQPEALWGNADEASLFADL